jgi:hypothetical protein
MAHQGEQVPKRAATHRQYACKISIVEQLCYSLGPQAFKQAPFGIRPASLPQGRLNYDTSPLGLRPPLSGFTVWLLSKGLERQLIGMTAIPQNIGYQTTYS